MKTCLCGMVGYRCDTCANIVCVDGLNTREPIVECINCAVGRRALVMHEGDCLSLIERVA